MHEKFDKAEEYLPDGLLCWYDFPRNSKILYIDDSTTKWQHLLLEQGYELTVVKKADLEFFSKKYQGKFDFVIAISLLEKIENHVACLGVIKSLLKSDGRLLLGVNNRLGIRYFVGDRDPYTNNVFDGLENYRRKNSQELKKKDGRLYDKKSVSNWLEEAGLLNHKYYSVFPYLENPSLVYADGVLPNEKMDVRYFPTYNHPASVFLEEQFLLDDLINNSVFHQMANAYFIECSIDGTFLDVDHATIQTNRGREDSVVTRIMGNGTVEKFPIFPEGYKKIEQLQANSEYLLSKNLKIVESKLTENKFIMPRIEAITAFAYFRDLLITDLDKFQSELDRFISEIKKSFDIVENNANYGPIVEKCWYDLVPINCFVIDGEFVFYDQEFYIENYPGDILIERAIDLLYQDMPNLNDIISCEKLMSRYGLGDRIENIRKKGEEFIDELRHKETFASYNKCHSVDYLDTIRPNQIKMNLGSSEIQKCYIEIFSGLDSKKLAIYGAGKYATRFMNEYGHLYKPVAFIDGNKDKQGTIIYDAPIVSVEKFAEEYADDCKVIVCVLGHDDEIVDTLHQNGITDISIYNPAFDYLDSDTISGQVYTYFYDREHFKTSKRIKVATDEVAGEEKKYHIGYVAGAFDMFHIGHLNLIRRAKEQCDYLIVGIMSDEKMTQLKGKAPIVPCNERMAVVAGCRYVDEVIELPIDRAGISDAYHRVHFDCMFSGDDHKDNPDWLAEQKYLRSQGSDLVFVSYTKEQSSSMLREKLK